MVILIALISQLFFTSGDLLARKFMAGQPFSIATFSKPWFLIYFLVRIIAMFGQLYILSRFQVGKTMLLFAVLSLILVNVLGFVLLKEILGPKDYVALSLTIIAFFILVL